MTLVSEGWGGRTSHKHLTENSTFLNNLKPGDLVLADRGFNIKDSVALMCAEVKIPVFKKGKPQLCPVDVGTTRKIAHVRIQVFFDKNMRFSAAPSPYTVKTECDGVTTLDKIINVGCAIINLCPSVVPFN